MIPNADVTIYRKSVDPVTRSEVWTRSQIAGVTWEDRKAANVSRTGNLEADRVAVYIFFASLGSANPPAPTAVEDVMVRGLVEDEISSAFTITALMKKYPEHATVRSVDRMDRGSARLRHWQIGAA